MITKWKIFNFKSIRKETDLQLAPLTLFVGPNSSGKSSVLQSIIMIAQTLAHKVGSRSVVLNGAMTKLGQFDDLCSWNSNANQILVGWECRPHEPSSRQSGGRRLAAAQQVIFAPEFRSLRSVACEVSFDANPGSSQRELYQLQPRLFSLSLEATLRTEDYSDINSQISISHAGVTGPNVAEKLSKLKDTPELDALRTALSFDATLDSDSLSELQDQWTSAQVIGCEPQHFLPFRLALEIDPSEEIAQMLTFSLLGEPPRALGIMRRRFVGSEAVIPATALERLAGILLTAIDDQLDANSVFSSLFTADGKDSISFREWFSRYRTLSPNVRDVIRSSLEASDELVDRIIRELGELIPGDRQLMSWRLPQSLAEATSYLDQFFSASVRYLGPLRDEPKPLYPLATAADPSDVGLRGELTAAVLDLHKDASVRYVPTSHFKGEDTKRKTVNRSLLAAVSDWVQYLGVADEVITHDRGKLGHELKVQVGEGGRAQDLTHVGVGVSQVLPILVMSLLAEEDTTLIFEQPELHLHPKVQTLLGDFFLSMALLGKQCIVETHSEYLINRLRYRAASAPLERSISDLMKIYFVEKNAETSAFREVVVNDYGAIPDWPEGFFDQSQSEAEEILKAAALKRKNARASQSNADDKH